MLNTSAYRWVKMASGTNPSELTTLDRYSSAFQEGDVGELRLVSQVGLPDWAATRVAEALAPKTSEWHEVIQPNSRTLIIRGQWGNPFPWLAVGLIVIAVIGVAWLLSLVWEFWRGVLIPVQQASRWLSDNIGKVAVFGGLALIAIVVAFTD